MKIIATAGTIFGAGVLGFAAYALDFESPRTNSGLLNAIKEPEAAHSGPQGGGDFTAYATLLPASGETASGRVVFRKEGGLMRVEATIAAAAPGKHGLHVHEFGDCGRDGNAAGTHFNPTFMHHGRPNEKLAHAGDLGNVEVGTTGSGKLVLELREADHPGLTKASDFVGRAMILHQGQDDLQTEPEGNSGKRIACGIIVSGARDLAH